jgi:hypothetical protein
MRFGWAGTVAKRTPITPSYDQAPIGGFGQQDAAKMLCYGFVLLVAGVILGEEELATPVRERKLCSG